jgi:Zn-dependent metalloprotease
MSRRTGRIAHLLPRGELGVVLPPNGAPEVAARAFFARYGSALQMKDPAVELRLVAAGGPNVRGTRFAAFSQQVRSVPVVGSRLSVQFDATGRISLVSGDYVPGLDALSTTPSLDGARAAERARAALAARMPDAIVEKGPAPELVIAPVERAHRLAYRVRLQGADGAHRFAMEYLVDAQSGTVLSVDEEAALRETAAVGIGTLGDTKGFPVRGDGVNDSPPYYMIDTTFTNPVVTRYVGILGGSTIYSSGILTSGWDPVAVDGYVYLGTAEQWWLSQGRISFDNQGASIQITPNDPTNGGGQGAWWERSDQSFHISKSAPMPPAVGLDELAHEFQHAVDFYTLQLTRTQMTKSNEAGAI